MLAWVAICMSAALVVTSLTAYGAYRKLLGNITHIDALSKLGPHRPDKPTKAQNILLIGSDTRQKPGDAHYGKDISGARSDTVIVLHLSPKRTRALLISFPRDSWVHIPGCQKPDGTMSAPMTTRLNAAFSTGGPACTWKTLEQDTNIHIDHFIQVDFAGFKNVVDALGGVRVCLPVDVHDPKSGLNLSAGPHMVRGDQALAFVRVRHNIGNGSDLERIQRQQEFMASVVKRATSMGILLNPQKLYHFLDVATRSVTTDNQLTVDDLRRIGESLKGLDPKHVKFVTVPVYDRADGATVAWRQPAAKQLFETVRRDEQVRRGGDHGSRPPTVPASQVKVRVLNGTNISGLAGRTADALREAGFRVVHVGNAPEHNHDKTLITHDPTASAQANTVAKAVPFATPSAAQSSGQGSPGTVTVVLGTDAEGADIVNSPAPSPGHLPKRLGGITANQNPCKTGALTR